MTEDSMSDEDLETFLKEHNMNVRGMFPGFKKDVTKEQRNKALYDSIQRLIRGEYTLANPEDFEDFVDDDEHTEQLESDKSGYGENHE